jgi:hypothetical protein
MKNGKRTEVRTNKNRIIRSRRRMKIRGREEKESCGKSN